jgi:NADPH:quinone reductase-like Zn-dependent oxidoreductase
MGCNATQLAVAAGYEVITACSPQKFQLMKRFGASRVFDYRSKTAAGALTLGSGAVEACLDILNNTNEESLPP